MVDDRYSRLDQLDAGCVSSCLPDCEPIEFQTSAKSDIINHRDFCRDSMKVGPAEKETMCGYFRDKFLISDPLMRSIAGSDLLDLLSKQKALRYTKVFVKRKTAMEILMTSSTTTIDMARKTRI